MSEIRACERLELKFLTLEEMKQIQTGEQNFIKESVLSEVVKTAISEKINRMSEVTEEVHPWLTYWLIQEKESGQGIGVIGSKFLPDEEGYVELGYAIATEYRGNGYMSEALEGFLDWLYEFPFCNGALLSIRNENIASVKVAEKCEFEYVEMRDGYRVYRYSF